MKVSPTSTTNDRLSNVSGNVHLISTDMQSTTESKRTAVMLQKKPSISELKRIKFNKIRIGDLLGNGAYGVVMKAKWNSSFFSPKKDVAIKIIKSDNDTVVKKEMQMMNRVKHPNIIKIFGHGNMPNGDHFIVMEFMDSESLDKVLHGNGNDKLLAFQLDNWALQIANGLATIHDHALVHRDLKPQNILMSNNRKIIKIGDFGTAREELCSISITKRRGTLLYMAPEVFDNTHYTSKCDVYSFGVTLCEMYTRQRPYAGEAKEGLMEKILNGLRPTIGINIDADIQSMIKRCLDANANRRLSMNEILANQRLIDCSIRIAVDKTRCEKERVTALVRLRSIWGDNDGWTMAQLVHLSKIIANANENLVVSKKLSDIDIVFKVYESRSYWINSITIDRTQCNNIARWLCSYASLLHLCFYHHASQFFDDADEYVTEFDRIILGRIQTIIVDKMQFILYDPTWSTEDVANDPVKLTYYIGSLDSVTKLLVAYRIDIAKEHMQLLNKIYAQIIAQRNEDFTMTAIAYRLAKIEEMQSTVIFYL